ncbi:glycosyltransferase [Candidatus Pelagibacter sp. Uisw_136]|uniref:glycosyltransferase n=1 Tax=Candidatus Pelagibacter sp. Uisw_136 TaxID=3230991 RepID=UPI0039E9F12F
MAQKLKVLIVSQYFWPEQFRINEMVEYLTDQDIEVDVLTGKPNYPDGKIYDNFSLNPKKFSKYKKSNIYRLPIYPRKNGSKFNLFLNYLSFVLAGILISPSLLKKKKYDAIFTFASSPITVAIVSIYLSKIKNCKSVIWVLDLWPEILLEMKIIKNRVIYYLLDKIVKYIYRKTDIILAQSHSFKKSINNKIKENKSIYFPAWPERLKFKKKIFFKEKKDLNKLNILFSGNIGMAQNFNNLIKVIECLKDNKKIMWHIVGSGKEKDNIIEICKNKNIENIKFYGHQSIDKIHHFHALADILLITLHSGKALSSTIPGKLQTYLNSNKYILGMINGESAKIIKETQAGFVTNADNVNAMTKHINYMSLNKIKILKKRSKIDTRKYVKIFFNKDILLIKLKKILLKFTPKLNIIKLIPSANMIPFERNFCLSGLNLAFLGFYNLNSVNLYESLYHWADGVYSRKIIKSKINKLPGRKLLDKMRIPNSIDTIYIYGSLTNNSKDFIIKKYKKKIIHVNLPFASANILYSKYCRKNFKKSDLIILTLPTPKQEQFAESISRNSRFFKVLCIGGAINMASGDEIPTPDYLEKIGLEFIWRLKTDTFRRLHRLIKSYSSYLSGKYNGKFNNISIKVIK